MCGPGHIRDIIEDQVDDTYLDKELFVFIDGKPRIMPIILHSFLIKKSHVRPKPTMCKSVF